MRALKNAAVVAVGSETLETTPETSASGDFSGTWLRVCGVVTGNDETVASSRLRLLQYTGALSRMNLHVDPLFLPYERFRIRRVFRLARQIALCDVVFVQRYASYWFNALVRVSGKPVVYDVDDGIHFIGSPQVARMETATRRERLLALGRRVLRGNRYYSRVRRPLFQMLNIARVVTVGSPILANDFHRLATKVVVIPTAVPVADIPVKVHEIRRPVRIGWIGGGGSLYHLSLLEPAFERLQERYGGDVVLIVVSSRPFKTPAIATEFVEWSMEKESDSVLSFDVAIMPLHDDLPARRKAAFKALLCMAHGIPVVVSPVGVNADVIEHGVDGYLASSTEDWLACFTRLIESAELRREIGAAGRETVARSYSADAVATRLAEIIRAAADPSPVK